MFSDVYSRYMVSYSFVIQMNWFEIQKRSVETALYVMPVLNLAIPMGARRETFWLNVDTAPPIQAYVPVSVIAAMFCSYS